ncbi:MAG: HlyD family secretion protein [Candidatus Omnitrophica bacterium]|nr:HlyD family secretion protein [Candidatus Omnitrophota bacterium]
MLSLKNSGKMPVIVIAGILTAIAAGAAWLHFSRAMQYESTDDAYVEGRIHMIASRVSGTVNKVYVLDNQPVKAGEPLVDLDQADYKVRVEEAKAAYAAEKARVNDAQSKISGAIAKVDVQQAVYKQAGVDLRRAGRLFADGALPKEKLEKAQTAETLAKAQLKAIQEEVAQAKAVEALEEALVEQRGAALDTAQLNLSYTAVKASADGYVTKKNVEEGNQVQAGQPLMAVVALDDVWVAANFKETQLKQVKPGQDADVRVDMYPGHVFTGKVDSIMAGTGAAFSLFPAENALGNYVKVVQRVPVKIVLDKKSDPDHVLRVGMSVVASIKVAHE